MRQLKGNTKAGSQFNLRCKIIFSIIVLLTLSAANAHASIIYKYESPLMYDMLLGFNGTEHFTMYFTFTDPPKYNYDNNITSVLGWGTWYSDYLEAQLTTGSLFIYGNVTPGLIPLYYQMHGFGLSPSGESLNVYSEDSGFTISMWSGSGENHSGGAQGAGKWSIVENVPEPATMLLLGLGLIGLAGAKRIKK